VVGGFGEGFDAIFTVQLKGKKMQAVGAFNILVCSKFKITVRTLMQLKGNRRSL